MAKLNGVGTGGPAGLGDIAPASVDPMERYWRIIRGQVQLKRRGWIVTPDWVPPQITGAELQQSLLENHTIPRQWQMLEDLFILLQRGRFMVKKPNWIEPPITAEMEDLVTETPIAVQTTDTEIIRYIVPDRCVVSFGRFGNMIDDSSLYGTVVWNIHVNKRPVRTYQDFLQQRGSIMQPTRMPKPLTVKGRDVVQVLAKSASAVNAAARLSGFLIAAETITQDGSYKDWNSK
jgi:hypothetical protein